ncbi:MAG: hypothetical protein ACXAAQ_13080 [Candidatus Thorarchaeota archaeon]|jgi:hypothetical protein
MNETSNNPFSAIEMWDDTMVTVNEGEDKKKVDAKRYRIRYLVGESEDKRFVDGGTDDITELSEKTLFLAPSVHRLSGDPFHYDHGRVESISGKERIDERTKELNRHAACADHETVEVIFESPGVECCAMSKDQAEKMRVPVQYVAGYMLGKDEGMLKVALSKTIVEDGETEYYDNIHIIPESAIKQLSCLE